MRITPCDELREFVHCLSKSMARHQTAGLNLSRSGGGPTNVESLIDFKTVALEQKQKHTFCGMMDHETRSPTP
jgi:hypothetical protein